MTTNEIDGKIYIGQKSTPVNIGNYIGSGKLLLEAFKEYGKNNFSLSILEAGIQNKQELNEREKYWIKHYDSKNPDIGYNMTDGGEGCENPRPEVINAKSISQKGKETWMKGKKHRPESIEKIKKNHADLRGKNHPQYGKPLSEETKRKMRENHADCRGKNNHSYNKKPDAKCHSIYKGVSRNHGYWVFYIREAPEDKFTMGGFPTEIEACLARNQAIDEIFGWKKQELKNHVSEEDIKMNWKIVC